MRVPLLRDRLSPLHRVLQVPLLCVIAAAAGAAGALPVTDRRPVASDGELRLRMESGRLVARPGPDPAVAVDADLPPGMALRWREVRGGWVLVVDDRERLLPRDARVTLAVPAGLRLRIDAGDAEVDLEGVGDGGLVLRAGRSPVRVASAATSALSVDTSGGDVRLELDRPGRVRASTVGGGLEVRAAALAEADLRLETLSGDLVLRVPTGGPVTVRPRLAGGVLTLPPAAKATPDGRVQLGEGAGRVELLSLSGDAALVEDAALAAPVPPAAAGASAPPSGAGAVPPPVPPPGG